MTTRERIHRAIRAASDRGCCNLPHCAFEPQPARCTLLCDALVEEFDAPAEDPAMPPPDVIEALAKDCNSCGECGEAPPCATCMAGGVCLEECRCGEADAEDHDDPDDDWDPSACPGCGGNCQVACR